jgi:hypothetical protein
LTVVPTLAEEGRIQLSFIPSVKHGQAQFVPHAAQDSAGALRWSLEAQQPEESFPWLSWERTVGPNEYLVVGTMLHRRAAGEGKHDTLGQRCFLSEDRDRPTQRVLVIRAVPAPSAPLMDETMSRSPPLALQAGWYSARGASR